MLVLDALRTNLVQKLTQSLKHADDILRRYQATRRRKNEERRRLKQDLATQEEDQPSVLPSSATSAEVTPQPDESSTADEEDPYLDADLEILKTFEQATSALMDQGGTSLGAESAVPSEDESHQAVLVISKNGTIDTSTETTASDGSSTTSMTTTSSSSSLVSPTDPADEDIPSPEEVKDAQMTLRHVRDYLPQLVSAVLKSPPASYPNLLNPTQRLRRLIVQRCMEDANWGIDMCWLLEAEVGRAWKTLFEHRQQTGKRLIVVLPAEKAAVLAKIGTEKRDAFDLLQDSEQATAYGYTVSMEEDWQYQYDNDGVQYSKPQSYHEQQQQQYQRMTVQQQHLQPQHHVADEAETMPPRLPSSLSLRRCSHFGDTMHFIDRLTQTSLDLRQVPVMHRHVSLFAIEPEYTAETSPVTPHYRPLLTLAFVFLVYIVNLCGSIQ